MEEQKPAEVKPETPVTPEVKPAETPKPENPVKAEVPKPCVECFPELKPREWDVSVRLVCPVGGCGLEAPCGHNLPRVWVYQGV